MSEIKVGDVCEIIADYGGSHGWTIGLECTVVGGFGMQRGRWSQSEGLVDRLGWKILIAGHGWIEWVATLGELRKKSPPADATDIESLDEVVA